MSDDPARPPMKDAGASGEAERVRARQHGRAVVMALILGGLVLLFYAIALVKMAGGG